MSRRNSCKVKAYHIYINGQFVSNSFGESQTQAISFYCKSYGIVSGRGYKVGCCGARHDMCARSAMNGRFSCGSMTKCQGHTVVPTNVGLISASPVM